MTKTIPCPVCWGMGCSRCDGAGVIRVPMTNLDWLKQPERTAEEAVDFIRGLCTEAAKADWCDAFDGDCRACLIAYLLAKRKEG